MNKKRLAKLEETLIWLRDTKEKDMPARLVFNLGTFVAERACRTHMCLAGWYAYQHPRGPLVADVQACNVVLKTTPADERGDEPVFSVLAEHFDLPESVIESMFGVPFRRYNDLPFNLSDRKFWAKRALTQLQLIREWPDDPDTCSLTCKLPEPVEVDRLADRLYVCRLKEAPRWYG